jgi:hypothetical protein
MSTTVSGNIGGIDIAIAISSNGVTVDLNGFTITVANHFDFPGHNYYAIAETTSLEQITVRNGNIRLSSDSFLSAFSISADAAYLPNSFMSRIEGLSVSGDSNTITTNNPVLVGALSTVRDLVSNRPATVTGCINFPKLGIRVRGIETGICG